VADSPHLRIGALSARVGVSPELLRAWEQRYGLLQPVRSGGGFRLYSTADEERVRAMRRHLDAGVSAAQAARLALAEAAGGGDEDEEAASAGLPRLSNELRAALDRLDEPAAQAAVDGLLATFTLQTVLRDVVLPYLHELGERWEQGEASVAQEHFASNLLRGRLLGLARGWGQGSGPAAVLACAPGELHDLPLIIFGLVLAAHGWQIVYLGPDTPIATIRDALADVEPRLVVIAAMTRQRLRASRPQLTALAQRVPVAIAGAGATDALARATGSVLLEADPVTAAERIAGENS
jgi:MerR family transcriptional regulator, light-induced transcriptional regulator